jgi:hypothetical protein
LLLLLERHFEIPLGFRIARRQTERALIRLDRGPQLGRLFGRLRTGSGVFEEPVAQVVERALAEFRIDRVERSLEVLFGLLVPAEPDQGGAEGVP